MTNLLKPSECSADLKVEAEAALQLTIRYFRSRLSGDDLKFLEQSMRFYGWLCVQEHTGSVTHGKGKSLLSGYKSNRISCLVFSGRSVRERPS